jgi:hypothetical protein
MAIEDFADSLEDDSWKHTRVGIFVLFGIFIPLLYIVFAVMSALN